MVLATSWHFSTEKDREGKSFSIKSENADNVELILKMDSASCKLRKDKIGERYVENF